MNRVHILAVLIQLATVTSQTIDEHGTLAAPPAAIGFGCSSSIDDFTVVVGSLGSVHTYERISNSWTLVNTTSYPSKTFGGAVSIYQSRMAVAERGSPSSTLREVGSVHIFDREGSGWNKVQRIEPPSPAANQFFGSSIALHEDTLVVTAVGSQSAFVFYKSGSSFTLQGVLSPAVNVYIGFGSSVTVYGDTAAVGAVTLDSRGGVYIFRRSGTTWTQEAILRPRSVDVTLNFGSSVSLYEDSLMIGSSGSAYVYQRSNSAWNLQSIIVPPTNQSGDGFGSRVSLHLNKAMVSAVLRDIAGRQSGAVFTFEKEGNSWNYVSTLLGSDSTANDWFGWTMAMQDNVSFIGNSQQEIYYYDFTMPSLTRDRPLPAASTSVQNIEAPNAENAPESEAALSPALIGGSVGAAALLLVAGVVVAIVLYRRRQMNKLHSELALSDESYSSSSSTSSTSSQNIILHTSAAQVPPPTPPAPVVVMNMNVVRSSAGGCVVGEMCQAKYSQDGKWYKARIEEIRDGHCRVWYVDFGSDMEWLPLSSVRPSPR